MELRGLKYIITPIKIEDNIYVRKRLLHKGYSVMTGESISYTDGEKDVVYTHVAHTNTLKHTETFIKNEYGYEVHL